ncbi:hypothetical protein ACLB2K_007110 [Fragaria x ananassa]
MPGLNPSLVCHTMNVEPRAKPVVQARRNYHKEDEVQIKQEIEKLLVCGFIKPIKHPTWLANIVPVKKKNGQVRICIDYRDLNKACPKDEFPLPNMDMLIDSTSGQGMLSFMDRFSSYNQIKMAAREDCFSHPIQKLSLHSHAFWFEKCRSNISARNDCHFS